MRARGLTADTSKVDSLLSHWNDGNLLTARDCCMSAIAISAKIIKTRDVVGLQ
jgi:hypothetical protein